MVMELESDAKIPWAILKDTFPFSSHDVSSTTQTLLNEQEKMPSETSSI